MAVAIMTVNGEIEVDVEIRAKIGATLKNVLGIRKIITRQTKEFDGVRIMCISGSNDD